jgi:molecular chaperone GrpE
MMSEKKARIEPESQFPGRDGDGQQPGTGSGQRPDIEELLPGLGEAASEAEHEAARIAALKAEVAELRDKWTRALAEGENVRRRAERDRRDAEAYGGTRLARDILTVWDNLERATKAADDELRANHAAFLEGVELTQRELLNAFAKHKIAKVTPQRGEKFDPNRHQAMFEAPVPGAEPGTVIEVLQDGFTISDRLLRPAMVGVARALPDAPRAEPEDGGAQVQAGDANGRDGGGKS